MFQNLDNIDKNRILNCVGGAGIAAALGIFATSFLGYLLCLGFACVCMIAATIIVWRANRH